MLLHKFFTTVAYATSVHALSTSFDTKEPLMVPSGASSVFSTLNIDPHMKMRLPERLPRRLDMRYHRLWQNAALTNSYLHRIGQTSSPYCDNCGLQETDEHVTLECPAYPDARCPLQQMTESLNPEPINLDLGTLPPLSGKS